MARARLTANKRVEPVVSISWASCIFICWKYSVKFYSKFQQSVLTSEPRSECMVTLYDRCCAISQIITIATTSCASGCVVECRICIREVAGSNQGLFKVYSAFHPSGVGKWVSAAAGKAKAGMAHSACGWNAGCAGKTVISLDNVCYTWAP